MRGCWEHFGHAADMGVRGIGGTKSEAFEQAALAMMAVVTDVAKVHARVPVELECEAPDDELLLVDWLNGVIYEIAARKMLFSHFVVQIDNFRLQGRAWGEAIDPGRHEQAIELKGATYTALRVRHLKGCWIAQTVVDV